MRKSKALLETGITGKVTSAPSARLLSDLTVFKKRMKKMRCSSITSHAVRTFLKRAVASSTPL